MLKFKRFYRHLLTGLGVAALSIATPAQASLCPEAALSQIIHHRVQPGETLAMVAMQYELQPATIVAINPHVPNQGTLPPGQVLKVLPFNGTVASSGGQTWQVLAERYGVMADLLFEINGCPAQVPSQVFIPQSNRNLRSTPTMALGYPLPTPTNVVLSYGWQPHSQRDELVFNSGIALTAPPGTVVQASARGVVAFVGEYNGAMLVVVNHPKGLQTRYGNLDITDLAVGDTVEKGAILGAVSGPQVESFMYFEVRTNSNDGWIARDPGSYITELDLEQ